MLTKTIKYTDFNGVEREEEFRFHLSKAELLEMELTQDGGLTAILDRIVKANDIPSLVKEFKRVVLMSYGVKSDDGRRFIKDDELRKAFSETDAYSQIFMELVTDDEAAAAFINGILPEDLRKKLNDNNTNVKSIKDGVTKFLN